MTIVRVGDGIVTEAAGSLRHSTVQYRAQYRGLYTTGHSSFTLTIYCRPAQTAANIVNSKYSRERDSDAELTPGHHHHDDILDLDSGLPPHPPQSGQLS